MTRITRPVRPIALCRCTWGSTTGVSVPCDEPVLAMGECRRCVSGNHTLHDRQLAVQQGTFTPTPWIPRGRSF